MTDLQAVLLGVVQGVTEFLPISSTAHLYLVDRLVFGKDTGAAFTAIIQLGTLLATLLYFRKDIAAIVSGRDEAFRRLRLPILAGTVPIVVAGLLLKKHIEGPWRSLPVVTGAMLLFAVLLALAEKLHRERKQLADVSLKDGLLVGLWQAFALIPGASRSGTTITGALFTGLERSTAARFSFLLSLPAIFLAGAKELFDVLKGSAAGAPLEARPVIIATVVAFVVGWLSIDWLLKFLRRYPTYAFVAYRLALGALLLSLFYSGVIR
jgi:undecaprenyl-diphosphatase